EYNKFWQLQRNFFNFNIIFERERATQQRLQELDVEKREPILLRCSALHLAHFVQINTLQRTSEIYKVLHEFHSAVSQSIFRLVPSLETDELPIRYDFASISGRSTCIQLRSSPIYAIHWHVISASKKVKIKHRAIIRLSSEMIIRPMKLEFAERWHMNWEYVIYRISHGVHFAIIKNITDMNPQQIAIHIRAQKAYPRRFIRSIIAPVQKKKVLKASKSNSITMCTVDRGEPCHVKRINIPEYRRSADINYYRTLEHISNCSSNSALIKCTCCYDEIE
uniref:Uncharacterized protein n=1 Tax=Onchocerca volvulus TaxID=6282 RepID=A0A8R1Y2I5_ONCVO